KCLSLVDERYSSDPHSDARFMLHLRVDRRVGVIVGRPADTIRIETGRKPVRPDHCVSRWPCVLQRYAPVRNHTLRYVGCRPIEWLRRSLWSGPVSGELRVKRVIVQRISAKSCDLLPETTIDQCTGGWRRSDLGAHEREAL